jgi:hypothetical protein
MRAKAFDDVSRVITIGFGEIGRLVSLSKSKCSDQLTDRKSGKTPI